MATKIAVAQKRIFGNLFICKNCSSKMRADPKKLKEGKIKCRKCGKRNFRTVKKK
jgi:formylmethanofuran dehydrogenase subunit E